MNDKLGIGFIGCGEIAVATAKGLAMAQNARLAMAMDVSEALAKDMGEQYQAPFTTDVDKLLASPDVHAVYIATPHHLHAPMAIKAAQAGKHVMVEKPHRYDRCGRPRDDRRVQEGWREALGVPLHALRAQHRQSQGTRRERRCRQDLRHPNPGARRQACRLLDWRLFRPRQDGLARLEREKRRRHPHHERRAQH
ncbi:MAG: Gfo/Idh/MocA family oxidoreductase [Planctomycetes bacterium]|nr:Gfo/Idh/MocA family oxidoreductase [Planctomycetota bacterium]